MSSILSITFISLWLLAITNPVLGLTNGYKKRISIVTGASGYVGREIVSVLLNDEDVVDGDARKKCDDEIFCLVRSKKVESEANYWERFQSSQASSDDSTNVRVLPYEMLDGGKSFSDALAAALQCGSNDDNKEDLDICVYHIASVFGPSEDHIQTAHDNVKGTKDLVEAMGKVSGLNCCRLVFTSSMAAVRGSGQIPQNEKYYTYEDWNTKSKLQDNNWGSSYQWSKAESERVAWEIAKEKNVPMAAICPSFVFGPPTASDLSSSFSITLVGQWVRGESTVQSRLFVDVRDVAKAHVAAAIRPQAVGERIIVSTEARIPSQEMAEILKDVCAETGLSDPEKVTFDNEFKGGAIPIGSQEVETKGRLNDLLDITLTPVDETIRDMGRTLLLAKDSSMEAAAEK